MIVIMAGLPGTGKSTLARALAQRLPGTVLDKDAIRAALFQPPHVEYSLAQDDFCQEIMLQTAAYLLAKDAELKDRLEVVRVDDAVQLCDARTVQCSLVLGEQTLAEHPPSHESSEDAGGSACVG